jgi:hypothetical protein
MMEYRMKSKKNSIIISFIVFETIVLTCIYDILINASIGEGIAWLMMYTLFVLELGFVVINIIFVRIIEDYKESNKQLFIFLNDRLLFLYVLVVISIFGFVYSVLVDPTYIIFIAMILSGKFFLKPHILFVNQDKLFYSDDRFTKIKQVKEYKIENNEINITLVEGKDIKINVKNEKNIKDFTQAISDSFINN